MTTRFVKKALFVLASSLLLTSCDAIEALPANYETKIVEGDDIYENIMGTLYDATSSSKKDDVLDRFLDIVTEDQFGTFEDLKKAYEGSDSDKDDFIEKHPAYKHTNKVGDDEEDDFLADKGDISVEAVRRLRLEKFYEAVVKAINKSFYADVTSKSFSDDTGKFFEKRLAYDKYSSLFDIKKLDTNEWYEGYLTSSLKEEDVSSVIHWEDGRYDDYINRRIIPTVYKDKIVENYLIENNYSTLGRAYGRKVNVITLKRDNDYKDLPNKLMTYYATTYIHGGKEIDFENLANAWRGFYGVNVSGEPVEIADGSVEKELLDACATSMTAVPFETKVARDSAWDALSDDEKLHNVYFVNAEAAAAGAEYHYYKETQYGQLIEKYTKIDESNRFPSEEASDALNEFTSNLTYNKEKGLTIKLADLALQDYTKDGWFVKNGGLSDLPTEIRDRLFNINVARNVDTVEPEDASHPYDSDNYVRNIKGHYYLTPKTSETGDDNNFVIYNDGTFYLIEVVEAVSTSKLDLDGKESYIEKGKGEDILFTEGVARELADVLGTKETYTNKAFAALIEDYSIKYHDSSIRDFFKEKYPELFEDED